MDPLVITPQTALLIIDMQRAIDAAYWAKDGERNNPAAEGAALRLMEAWREAGRPIYHVRHDSVEPQSAYRPGQPGHQFKPGFEPREGEVVIPKRTGSAFTATPLEELLRKRGHAELVAAGVITNNSVETTVRHAGTLGFGVTLAEDACFTFARRDWDGVLRPAGEVHALSLANLEGEYCRVATAAEILAAAGSRQPILPSFKRPAAYEEWDPRVTAAAAYLAELIEAASPRARVEHVGSTAVPGCPGKNVIDLLVMYPDGFLESTKQALAALGFQPQLSRDPFPEDRPMRVGALAHGNRVWRIHAHVIHEASKEAASLLRFRDGLRADRSFVEAYAEIKRAILARGIRDPLDYAYAKEEFIRAQVERLTR